MKQMPPIKHSFFLEVVNVLFTLFIASTALAIEDVPLNTPLTALPGIATSGTVSGEQKVINYQGQGPIQHFTDIPPQMVKEGTTPRLGRGYDTFENSLKGLVLVEEQLETEQGAPFIDYSLVLIENYQQLAQFLHIGISASFNGMTGSGDARLDYWKSREFSSNSVYIAARVRVVNSKPRQLKDYLLKNENILPAARTLTPQEFYDRFGDSAIISTTSGGELDGIIEFYADSTKEREDIVASAKVQVGNFSASADFEQHLSAISSNKRTKVRTFQWGGPRTTYNTVDELLKAAKTFPDDVKPLTKKEIEDNSRPGPADILFEVLPFASVSNWPHHRPAPNLTNQKDQLEILANQRDRCFRIIGDIRYIQENPAQFDIPLDANLETLTESVKDLIWRIEGTGKELLLDPFHKITPVAEATVLAKEKELAKVVRTIDVIDVPLSVTVVTELGGPLTAPQKATIGCPQCAAFQSLAIQVYSVPGLHIVYEGLFSIPRGISGVSYVRKSGQDGYTLPTGSKEEGYFLVGLKISLAGERAKYYDVYYQIALAYKNWTPVAKGPDWIQNYGVDEKNRPATIDGIKVWVTAKSTFDKNAEVDPAR